MVYAESQSWRSGDNTSSRTEGSSFRNPQMDFVDLLRDDKASGPSQVKGGSGKSDEHSENELDFGQNNPLKGLGPHEFSLQEKEPESRRDEHRSLNAKEHHGRGGEDSATQHAGGEAKRGQPGTDTVPASNTVPAIDTVPASNTVPGTDTVPASNAAPATDTVPASNTAPATDTVPTSNTAPATDNNSTPVSSAAPDSNPASIYAADSAAVQAINSLPTDASSMNVGDMNQAPALPENLTSGLNPVVINGNGDLSSLAQYGNLTQNSDGSYVFDGNGQQVPPLVLNGVSNLTVRNSVFSGIEGGAVTITGGSNNVAITANTFSDIGSGVNVLQANNVEPTNIAVTYNDISKINGPWPAASAIQFAGAGAAATAAVANGHNDISHNTINDASTNSALSGQDIISSYSFNDGSNNAATLIYGNSITGSYTTSDGSHPPDSAINAELSSNVTIAGNFATGQSEAGFGTDGSTNVQMIGNLVTQSVTPYANSAEGGITPTGTWMYNNSDVKPQVVISSSNPTGGWPELYSPAGLTNDPGNTNNWDT